MKLRTKLYGTTYQFKDIKDVLAKANEEKSGDMLLGIGAGTVSERIAAKVVLSELNLEDLKKKPGYSLRRG